MICTSAWRSPLPANGRKRGEAAHRRSTGWSSWLGPRDLGRGEIAGIRKAAPCHQESYLELPGFGMTFEIVSVVPGKETREVVAPYLERGWQEAEIAGSSRARLPCKALPGHLI